MGKRSDFARVERDFYPTPLQALEPLLPHLCKSTVFYEPCAGDGRLVGYMRDAGHNCVMACDIEPRAPDIDTVDVFDLTAAGVQDMGIPITNPPWKRSILHPLIEHLLDISGECWLLFDADWPHTKQSAELMRLCTDIVPVGRVKWIPDSPHTGKDNCCWYRFSMDGKSRPAELHPRRA